MFVPPDRLGRHRVVVLFPPAKRPPGFPRHEAPLSQKSEVRSQKSEVRSQKSEVRSQKSEVRSQKSEVRSPLPPVPFFPSPFRLSCFSCSSFSCTSLCVFRDRCCFFARSRLCTMFPMRLAQLRGAFPAPKSVDYLPALAPITMAD